MVFLFRSGWADSLSHPDSQSRPLIESPDTNRHQSSFGLTCTNQPTIQTPDPWHFLVQFTFIQIDVNHPEITSHKSLVDVLR